VCVIPYYSFSEFRDIEQTAVAVTVQLVHVCSSELVTIWSALLFLAV